MNQRMNERGLLLRLLRALGGLALVVLVALALVSGLVFVQGQRSEVQRVDVIVVLYPASAPSGHLNHAVELYRQGQAARLLLVGADAEEQQASLVSRGLPQAALFAIDASGSRTARVQAASNYALSNGLSSALLVSTPEHLLLDLKIAHDQGLEGHGAPLPTAAQELPDIMRASLDYWRYVLLGS
jgi:hypothetical protein